MLAVEVLDEQAAARERDAVLVVGRDPLLPQRARHVAEHRAAVEPLAIALNRPEPHAAPPRARRSRRRTAAPRAARTAGSLASSCAWRAARDDAAVIHHDDAIGLEHGREPVRDDDRRALRHEPLERLLHEQLALRVERARRLVEQQDRRVLEDRARDRDALPLPAREPHAALAEERVVALRQRAQELVGLGRARRGLDLGVARVGPAVADVLARRRAEQHRVLRHEADQPAHVARDRARAMSTPSISTRPVGRIVEAQQQLERRALAGARRPDERDGLAGLDRHREVVERRALGARRIAEPHVLELDAAAAAVAAARAAAAAP